MAVALLAVLACLPRAAAKSTHAQLKHDDRSLVLLAEPFGFSETGTINLTVSDFTLWTPGHVKKTVPFTRCAMAGAPGGLGACQRLPPAGANTAATRGCAAATASAAPRQPALMHAQRVQPDADHTPMTPLVPGARPTLMCGQHILLCPHSLPLPHPPRPAACRLGFFITTPAAEGRLELNLAEGKCPLDSTDITITLFKFDDFDKKTGTMSREFRLADMLQVGHTVVVGAAQHGRAHCAGISSTQQCPPIPKVTRRTTNSQSDPPQQYFLSPPHFTAFHVCWPPAGLCGRGVLPVLRKLRARQRC
jgi:hypothetical protein